VRLKLSVLKFLTANNAMCIPFLLSLTFIKALLIVRKYIAQLLYKVGFLKSQLI